MIADISRAGAQEQYRDICLQCLKAKLTCYCAEVARFQTSLEVVILQHPHERRKAIGTARMTHLMIERSRLIVGKDFSEDVRVNDLIGDPAYHCVVLFPGPQSVDVGVEGARAFPQDRKLLVFVIDGTWATAKKMLRDSPNILELPQIRFTPETRSEYRIRKQPAPECVSTIEAVHRLLTLLDPTAQPEPLMRVFRHMVDQQIALASAAGISYRPKPG